MCAWKYKRIMSKVTVAKLKLMEPKKITDLLGMKLRDIFSMLEKTPYNKEISEISAKNLNSNSLEEALLRNFIKSYEDLVDFSPKGIRLLISSFLTKFEVNCVKAMLRTKEANLSNDEAMKFIIPAGKLTRVKCKEILENSEKMDDVIESLSDMEYGPVLDKALTEYKEERIFYLLEVALDRYVYFSIWRSIGKLGGLDKKIAKTIVGIEVDIANIKTILRCKEMGIKEEQIKRYLIPVSEVFGEKELYEIIKDSDTSTFINSLVRLAKQAMARDYSYIFTELQQQNVTSLTTIEMILDKGLIKTSLRMIKRYTQYFNLGLVLAYLNLKWFEIRNLRAIIRGTEAGISPEKIKKTLILVK